MVVGKDIVIFDLDADSAVESESGVYGNIDVYIWATIKEAKSTKVHTVEVKIKYRNRHNTDNWQGELAFDGRTKKLDEESCSFLCEQLFEQEIYEQEIYWKYNDSEMKEFAGQLITDLISGKYIKLS